MKKDIGFYFIPKKWLGDATILTMDWDCKAMHFHLMCIAAQQEKQGYLIDDENISSDVIPFLYYFIIFKILFMLFCIIIAYIIRYYI